MTKSVHFSAALRKSLHIKDCVVVEAVDLEPVSNGKFPANREKNREFPNMRLADSSEDS